MWYSSRRPYVLMLFNLFYSDLVRTIQSSKYGVNIRGKQFNCFCYADDLMICSLTVSGLQHLIDLCVSYVSAIIITPTLTWPNASTVIGRL